MSGVLQDKVIIVTGAASGIGESAAQHFAGQGARVVLADINAEQGTAVALGIEESGGSALFVAVDVSREEQVEAMIEAAMRAYGRIDGAFNNAGVGQTPALTADTTEAEWQRLIAINLTGSFLCMKHEIRCMLKTGGGSIVNMSSVVGLRALPMQVAYSVTKHGVIGLTKTAATEYAKAGIRVNAVCPGAVDTPSLRATDVDWNKVLPIPLGRIAQSSEVVELVQWLLSDRASYITGQAYPIDGGMTATVFPLS